MCNVFRQPTAKSPPGVHFVCPTRYSVVPPTLAPDGSPLAPQGEIMRFEAREPTRSEDTAREVLRVSGPSETLSCPRP